MHDQTQGFGVVFLFTLWITLLSTNIGKTWNSQTFEHKIKLELSFNLLIDI
jgi:hypothetical protein